MWKQFSAVGALSTLTLAWVLSAQSPAQKAIDDSIKAMGASDVKTLTLWGEGGDGAVGQQLDAKSDYWRWYKDTDVVRGYDFGANGYRTKRIRGEGNVPPGGGNGTTTPAPTAPQDQITMVNNFNSEVEMAMTPIGFLKMAQAKNATLSTKTEKGKKWTVLSYPMTGGQGKATFPTTVSGYIDDKNLVQKVEVMISQDFLGDIKWDAQFSDWKDFDGVKFPAKIVQRQWHPKIYELNVSDVKLNQPVDLTPPAAKGKGGAPGGGAAKGGPGGPGAAKGGAPEVPASLSEDLGGGFWLVTGGYGAIVANFKDYIVLVEGAANDARMDQVIAEAKRLVPNKPIRYIVNTHFHYDHTTGLRAAVANGITIITHKDNKGLFEEVMGNSHALVPDELQGKSPRPKVKLEYVGDKKVYTDGEHTIELHRIQGSTHNTAMLIVYLPKQKILLNADEFNVNAQAPTAPVPMPNGYQVNLLKEIERLNLDVERHIPVHLPNGNRKVTQQELRYMAGKQ